MAVKRSAEAPATRPFKKPRTEGEENAERPASTQPKQVFTSALVADEADFPRGGGTTLTPLEYKEIREEGRQEADRDVDQERKKKQAMREKRKNAASKVKVVREEDKDVIRECELYLLVSWICCRLTCANIYIPQTTDFS